MKILLVEDDANLREVTQRSLEKERYVVEIAADYRTALWDMHIEILLKEYLRGYSNADAKVEEFKNIYFDSLNGKTIDIVD